MIQKIISDSPKESDDWSRCSIYILIKNLIYIIVYICESHENDFSLTHACLCIYVYHFSSYYSHIGPTRKAKEEWWRSFWYVIRTWSTLLLYINNDDRNGRSLHWSVVWCFSYMNVSCVYIQINCLFMVLVTFKSLAFLKIKY